jgi:MFS family permease
MQQHFSRLKAGMVVLYSSEIIATLVFSFMPIFLKEQGYNLGWIIFIPALATGISLIPLFLVREYDIRKSIAAGFLIYCGSSLLLLFFPPGMAFLYAMTTGVALVFFWVPLNYIFFTSSQDHTHATDSAIYTVPDMFGIFLPLLGALIVTTFSYKWLFGLGAILYFCCALLALRFIPTQEIKADPHVAIKNFTGLRLITALDGSLDFFANVIVPIYALLFFSTATSISFFLSYLGIISFVIALVLSHHSDRTQRRQAYIFALFTCMAISTISLIFVGTAFAWVIAAGVFTLWARVSWPLRNAICMDKREKNVNFWVAREIFLNTGRLITIGAASLLFYFKLYWVVFVLFSAIAVTYPFLVKKKLSHIR